MESLILERLKLKMQPVGVSFTDIKPDNSFEPERDKRTCVMTMILECSKGRIVAFSDETCTCAGGAVGLCFGDAFTRRKHKTVELLSTGMENTGNTDKGTATLSPHLRYGERFFASPEIAQRWKESLPYTDALGKYTVLTPLSEWDENKPPELVYLFADPDQLSALVIMCGFYRGAPLNVVAPFAAACQSILLAYQEINKDEPKAIMGGFDISQRHSFSKELLTLTMPYRMFSEIESGIDKGCLTTDSWTHIAHRFD